MVSLKNQASSRPRITKLIYALTFNRAVFNNLLKVWVKRSFSIKTRPLVNKNRAHSNQRESDSRGPTRNASEWKQANRSLKIRFAVLRISKFAPWALTTLIIRLKTHRNQIKSDDEQGIQSVSRNWQSRVFANHGHGGDYEQKQYRCRAIQRVWSRVQQGHKRTDWAIEQAQVPLHSQSQSRSFCLITSFLNVSRAVSSIAKLLEKPAINDKSDYESTYPYLRRRFRLNKSRWWLNRKRRVENRRSVWIWRNCDW